jgi:hypothetical protein
MSFLRNALVVFVLFAAPGILLTLVLFLSEPRMLIAIPMVPFVAVVLALNIFAGDLLSGAPAIVISILVVAAFCSLLGRVHAREPKRAKIIALVVGVVNALLIPMLAQHFA